MVKLITTTIITYSLLNSLNPFPRLLTRSIGRSVDVCVCNQWHAYERRKTFQKWEINGRTEYDKRKSGERKKKWQQKRDSVKMYVVATASVVIAYPPIFFLFFEASKVDRWRWSAKNHCGAVILPYARACVCVYRERVAGRRERTDKNASIQFELILVLRDNPATRYCIALRRVPIIRWMHNRDFHSKR